ncbi:hypothetical protein HYH03_014257 [Edaphochlamys debaryana]|uniref:NACHT domain-containing protein n=1 Tax=Edaphochlamys debaryana TaxID=47281 RepID=A0A835XWN7_9CHLO|nr:hypothetical protein HYH03_014257 [Edaphochlamys debaryana]|eukprot:KAG2487144.1 hypothetical protein HYH03_014257 [Edaphochlamys debaryana]
MTGSGSKHDPERPSPGFPGVRLLLSDDEDSQYGSASNGRAGSAARAAGPPPLLATKAITLRGLRKLKARFQKAFGDSYRTVSTDKVCQEWVKDQTKSRRCALVELTELVETADLGTPHYFVSHAWKCSFYLLIRSIENFLEGSPEETRVWVDVLCMSQHPSQVGQGQGLAGPGVDLDGIKEVIRSATCGMLVVSDMSICNTGTRAWCCFEWAACLAVHGPELLYLQLSASDRAALVGSIDIERSEASRLDDKLNIQSNVIQEYGSAQAFNDRLKLALMLQPLSYRVDMRRLGRRAKETDFEFVPVTTWLSQHVTLKDQGGLLGLVTGGGGGGGGGTVGGGTSSGQKPNVSSSGTLVEFEDGAVGTGGCCGLFRRKPPPQMLPSPTMGSTMGGMAMPPPPPQPTGKGKGKGTRVLCVLGDSGEGKSTIAAALLEAAATRDAICAHHFIRANDKRRLSPVAVITTLVFQLAERFPQLRPHLFAVNTAGLAANVDPDAAFAALLRKPLDKAGLKQQVVILIDALDEGDTLPTPAPTPAAGLAEGGEAAEPLTERGSSASSTAKLSSQPSSKAPSKLTLAPSFAPYTFASANGQTAQEAKVELESIAGVQGPALPSATGHVCINQLFTLLVSQLRYLPPTVRFIITANPNAMGGQMRAFLDKAFEESGGITYVSAADLRRSTDSPRNTRLGLCGLSQGHEGMANVLTYHTVVEECIKPKNMSSPQSSMSGRIIPVLTGPPQLTDLHTAYGMVFQMAWESLSKEDLANVKLLLAVIAAAQEPLHDAFIGSMGLGSAIGQLPGHPVMFYVEDHKLYTHHKALDDWLKDPALSGAYTADIAAGHSKIAKQLMASIRKGATPTPYSGKYLVRHLAACGDVRASLALEGLIYDYVFLADVFSQGLGHDLVRDLLGIPAPPPLVVDGQRWLMNWQYKLIGAKAAKTAKDVSVTGLRCPFGTQAYKRAEKHALSMAKAGNRPMWKLKSGLGAPKTWGPLKGAVGRCFGQVTSVSWSSDGRAIACSESEALRLWDPVSGECIATLQGHLDWITCVAWSPDSRLIATASEDKALRLWDAFSGLCTATLKGHAGVATSLAWSPDGRCVASGSKDKVVKLWDVETRLCTATLKGHTGAVSSVAWSPDGKAVISGSEGRTLRVWDVGSKRCTATLKEEANVTCVAWSPDGLRVAVTSRGGTTGALRLWTLATGECGSTLAGHSDNVLTTVAWSPDGRLLASGGFDKTVRLWDAEGGACRATLEGHSNTVSSIAWSPDGRTLTSSGDTDYTLRMWDVAAALAQAEAAASAEGHAKEVTAAQFSPEGDLLATGSADASIRLWEAGSGKLAGTLEGHTDTVTRLAFNFSGKMLASGSKDKMIRIWNVEARTCTSTLEGQPSEVVALAWSSSGVLLASGSSDGKVLLWNSVSGQCTSTFDVQTPSVSAMAFSPDAKVLATGGGASKAVRLWDVGSGKAAGELEGHLEEVLSISWSPNSRSIASGSEDKSIKLWDVATRECTATLKAQEVTAMAWSPEGKTLAVCSKAKSLRLWDVASRAITTVLHGHNDNILCVAWSQDAQTLATGSADRTVRVYGREAGSGASAQAAPGMFKSVSRKEGPGGTGGLLSSGSKKEVDRAAMLKTLTRKGGM